jgi:hypothetical protein
MAKMKLAHHRQFSLTHSHISFQLRQSLSLQWGRRDFTLANKSFGAFMRLLGGGVLHSAQGFFYDCRGRPALPGHGSDA